MYVFNVFNERLVTANKDVWQSFWCWLDGGLQKRSFTASAARVTVNKRQTKHVIFTVSSMMTSSNGTIFRVTGPLCGEFTGHGEFPSQKPVARSFDDFFDLCLNKRLSKQSRRRWFETPLGSLWRHCIWSVFCVITSHKQCLFLFNYFSVSLPYG